MSGIRAIGAYLPRLRLQRATIAAATAWMSPPSGKAPTGARAVCNWDEDAITMAVAAAQACKADLSRVTRLQLASTTLPFADRSNAGLVAAALALNEEIETADVGGSQRCGTSAMIRALRNDEPTLLIASEKRQAKPGSAQELVLGHGAVAMLIGGGAGGIECLGSASLARDFVDHHRSEDADFDYVLEERWVRDEAYFKMLPDTIKRALSAASVSASTVSHLIIPASAAVGKRIAQSCGIPAESLSANPASQAGDLGCAHPMFALALVLESAKAGDLLVLVGFGQGVDAIVLRVGQPLPAGQATAAIGQGVVEPSYVRYLSNNGLLEMDFGMRSERDHRSAQTVAYRRRDAIAAFIGGRCQQCGTVQFPRSRVCVNPDCRQTDTQVPHRFADQGGRVKTFTEDWQAYSPRPPYIYGNVTFSEGGNLFMEFCDLEPGELRIDMPVRFQFRIKDIDRLRNFKRYFWKATPAG